MNALTYLASGVDIDTGNKLIKQIVPLAKSTYIDGVLSGPGGFAGLFEPDLSAYKNPILVASSDGVGTKLKLAIQYQQHNGIGIDLVAMCVNDLVVQGAKPLFFLDYYASAKLDIALAKTVIAAIAKGCQQAGCALIGGETAEMPGIYQTGDYDLAGFCVGIVDKNKLIDGKQISRGDIIIGLKSSGVHANGFSLVRNIINKSGDTAKITALLTPTKIYVNAILTLLKTVAVQGIAHITGGGLLENIPRILPKQLSAVLKESTWQMPEIFTWLQKQGNISKTEMYRVFNCGIGMVIIVKEAAREESLKILKRQNVEAMVIGKIIEDKAQSVYIQ